MPRTKEIRSVLWAVGVSPTTFAMKVSRATTRLIESHGRFRHAIKAAVEFDGHVLAHDPRNFNFVGHALGANQKVRARPSHFGDGRAWNASFDASADPADRGERRVVGLHRM